MNFRILVLLASFFLSIALVHAASVLPAVTPGSASVYVLKPARSAVATTDTAPPITTSGPTVSNPTSTGAMLKVTINENGTGYYYVQLASVGTDPSVSTVQTSGVAFSMTGGAESTQTISGLASGTNYKLYFVGKDTSGNIQTAVQPTGGVAFTTTTDSSKPTVLSPSTMTAGNPEFYGLTENAVTFSVAVDKNATGYFVVKSGGTAGPASGDVMAGSLGTGGGTKITSTSPSGSFSMLAKTQYTITVSNLTGNTYYGLYFVAANGIGNSDYLNCSTKNPTTLYSAAGTGCIAIKTNTDITPPVTTAGPSVLGTGSTSTTLSATINEAGTGCYIVQRQALAAPSIATLSTCSNSFGMTKDAAALMNITGLLVGNSYTVYFLAKDTSNNFQTQIQTVDFTTLLSGSGSSGGANCLTYELMEPVNACCVATNFNHVTYGRATTDYATNVYALGSGTNLGTYAASVTTTTALKKTASGSPDTWTKNATATCP